VKIFELHVRPQTLIDVEELEVGESFTMPHENLILTCKVKQRREVDVIADVQEMFALWDFDFGEMVMPLARIREVIDERAG